MPPTMSTEQGVEWSKPLSVTMKQANLTEVISDSIMRGIAQAARGEGTVIDINALPHDDDE